MKRPLHFQVVRRKRRLKVFFVFSVFMIEIFVLMVNVCFCCVFPYQAKRLAWEMSPKWPVLCRVGCKTLTQSISRVVGYRWHCVVLVSDVMMSVML